MQMLLWAFLFLLFCPNSSGKLIQKQNVKNMFPYNKVIINNFKMLY